MRLPVSRSALAAVAAFALGGCATTVPPVSEAMVRARPGTPRDTLEEGRRIFAGPCIACHAPYRIASYSAAEWDGIVRDMAGRTRLNEARQRALLAYLFGVLAAPPEAG